MSEESRRREFEERYATGGIPWDDVLPPPELMAFVARSKPGRALDLGCGYGRSSIYLARHGWHVDGVDFVPQAVGGARQRAEEAGVAERVRFYAADVARLTFLEGPYDFAVDIGCMHAMSDEALVCYRDGLARLLAHGATYLLFAHLRDEDDETDEDGPRWIAEETLLALFAGFDLQHAEYGVTQVEDKPPWRSAWFTYRVVNKP
jgi:cyclopropane fatty-acyl-phospholipid synthase-like methyltransferase